jgi:hypothetical protein
MDMYKAKDSWKEPGHWTKEPPTEPGWYKAVYTSGVVLVSVISDKDSEYGLFYVNPQNGFTYPVSKATLITYWWSCPEILPPLPGEEE